MRTCICTCMCTRVYVYFVRTLFLYMYMYLVLVHDSCLGAVSFKNLIEYTNVIILDISTCILINYIVHVYITCTCTCI